MLSKKGLKHGLDRRLQDHAAVTIKAGEILKNSIRINELSPKSKEAVASYVLFGAAKNSKDEPILVEFVVNSFDNSVETVNVLKSLNAKREPAVRNAPKLTENPLLVTDSTISIADILEIARRNFPDVLPESVLRHFGIEARPEGELGESALYSRELPVIDRMRKQVAGRLTKAQADRVIYDAMDHGDAGDDNVISLCRIPEVIGRIAQTDGALYVYRNHLYENMVSEEQAVEEGRYNPNGHYHKLGEVTMRQALMALENPSIVIADRMRDGNPSMTIVLPVFDHNDWPIHAVVSFYEKTPINGKYEKRPHIAVTFYGHDYKTQGGRKSIVDVVRDAIEDGKILYLDKKARADLPVIAKRAPLGNVTRPALEDNVAQFQKEVKRFKQANKIDYSRELPVIDRMREEYRALLEQYGEISKGENPYREAHVPKKTAKDLYVSETIRTVLEAKATPDAAVPKLEELIEDGVFSYERYTDKAAMEEAEAEIKDKGYSQALADWMLDMQKGVVSKSNTAIGWALYNEAANAKDLKTAMSILTNMVEHQRNAAQAVQASRILKKMSPDAQLYGIQRSVSNLQKELKERYGKRAPDLIIDETLARQFLEAGTDKAREDAMNAIYKDIGKQVPSRFIDKWNAWRYLSMLGNLRTHVRNVAGNAFFAPVVATKNMAATAEK